MSVTTLFLLLLPWPLLVALSSAHPNAAEPHSRPLAARDSNSRNVPPLGFYDPRDHGGSWLTVRLTRSLSSSLSRLVREGHGEEQPVVDSNFVF
jgi:hypothetical protein